MDFPAKLIIPLLCGLVHCLVGSIGESTDNSQVKTHTIDQSNNSKLVVPGPTLNLPASIMQEVEIEMGERLVGSTIECSVHLSNTTSSPVEFPRISSSCGCFKSLPKNLILDVKTERESNFQIELSREPGKFEKFITFWDENNQPKYRMLFKGSIVPPVELSDSDYLIENDRVKTISIVIRRKELVHVKSEASSAASTGAARAFDEEEGGGLFGNLTIKAQGAEVVNQRWNKIDSESGTLSIEIDPKLSSANATQSEMRLDVMDGGKSLCTLPLKLRFGFRSIFNPKVPYLQKHESGYRTHLMVWSDKLEAELKKGEGFKGAAINDKGNNIEEVNVMVTPEIVEGKGPTSRMHIKISSQKEGVIRSVDRIRLQCGEWDAELLVKFSK